MENSGPRPKGQIAVGVVLLLIGLFALFGSGALPALIFIAIGASILWRRYNLGNVDFSAVFAPPVREDNSIEIDETPSRQTGAEKVYAHALRAVEKAGLNPDEVSVLPVDIGFMMFKGDTEPVVYRAHPVPDDADYIQPFVQLRVPTRAAGRIRFEIVDSDGQVLFIHEDMHQLERGRNLISPAARLPVHDAQAMYKDWLLRVTADGVPLATHTFQWEESETRMVRRNLTEDGEINNELRAAMAENRLQKMSLDELLEFQNDEDPPQQRQQGRR